MNLEFNFNFDDPDAVSFIDPRLMGLINEINNRTKRLETQGAMLMATFTDIKALILAIDEDTSAIAAKIDALLEQISTGMSQEQVNEVTAELAAVSERLDVLGQDPENPVPPVEPPVEEPPV
jgi:hypothetical protein